MPPPALLDPAWPRRERCDSCDALVVRARRGRTEPPWKLEAREVQPDELATWDPDRPVYLLVLAPGGLDQIGSVRHAQLATRRFMEPVVRRHRCDSLHAFHPVPLEDDVGLTVLAEVVRRGGGRPSSRGRNALAA